MYPLRTRFADKVDACAYGHDAYGVHRSAFKLIGEKWGLLRFEGSAARAAFEDMIDGILPVGYEESCS